MAFTYTAGASNKDDVRLIITDTDVSYYMFEDEEITVFLTLCSSDVLYAAAMALDTIASNEVLVQKRIRILDLSTDGPSEATALRAHAESLRAQSKAAGAGFKIAEWVLDQFGYVEKINKEAQRE